MEKKKFDDQKTHTLQLMYEKNQRHVDSLRSQLAKRTENGEKEEKLVKDLDTAIKSMQQLEEKLAAQNANASSVSIILHIIFCLLFYLLSLFNFLWSPSFPIINMS